MSILDPEVRKEIAEYINSQESEARITLNNKLFTILEGMLEPLLAEKMLDDLGKKSFESAKNRMAPINYYRKVIDKLTSIYTHGVVREVIGGTQQDEDLVLWYEKILGLNAQMNNNNEALNAYNYSLLQITLDDEKPDSGTIRNPIVRTIPNNKFLIMNTSNVDPTSADIIIVFAGKVKDSNQEEQQIYHVYTDEEFVIINGSGQIMIDMMNDMELDGTNTFGVKPFVYANMSHNLVMPLLQTDDLAMALLVPLLLTDLNYAVKFQAFAMFIAIDIDDSKIEISPNAVQHLKSDPSGDKPSFDVVKPAVDITEVLNLSSSQTSLWLSSKGIRPGAVGEMSGDQFASGISKMIDESDTYESRKRQIEIYKVVERQFWDILLKRLHPIWVNNNLVENRTIFTPSAEVVTEFPTPKPLQSKIELIQEIKEAIDAGLESRAGALAELHPDWDEKQIQDKIDEIDREARLRFTEFMGDENGEEQNRNENQGQGS